MFLFKKEIDYDSACKKAYNFYKRRWGVKGLDSADDVGIGWIFYPKMDGPVFDKNHIIIYKNDGSIKPFVLPNSENFKLLDNRKRIDVPDKYKLN